MVNATFPPPDDADDAARLEALLRDLGATEAELRAAAATKGGGALALDLVLRRGRPPMSLADAAAKAGADSADFVPFWQAFGFAAADTEPRVSADLADALPLLARTVLEWLGPETALGLARVVGSAGARLAEAVVDAFRRDFEVPELAAGASYSEVVERYTTVTREGLPALEALFMAVLKAHMVRVAAGAWAPDEGNAATGRYLFVGFVDLVGYTALSRTLSAAELAALVGTFERVVSDVVTKHGGRVVKLIGDGAMFVADDSLAGCDLSLRLSHELAGTDALPPARVGADCGRVLSLHGDYYGDVVNHAARLVALANPGTVVVGETVATAVEGRFAVEQLPSQALKGFGAPAVTYRLLPR